MTYGEMDTLVNSFMVNVGIPILRMSSLRTKVSLGTTHSKKPQIVMHVDEIQIGVSVKNMYGTLYHSNKGGLIMISAKLYNNSLELIVLTYNGVDISIAIRNGKVEKGEVKVVDVDSIKLFHGDKGEITSIYTHSDDYFGDEIYLNPDRYLMDELKSIMNFIDRLNDFTYNDNTTTNRKED